MPVIAMSQVRILHHLMHQSLFFCTVWNKELLYIGGFLARSVYELELDAIKKQWNRAAAVNGPGALPDEEVQTWLRRCALHALKFFTFHPSTPSPVVSKLMETAFFDCATTHPFSIISSDGVRNLSQVYIPDPKFSGFLKRLPLIPKDIVNGAKAMVAALRSQEMIKDITFMDVLDELRLSPLSETETVECLKWWIGIARQGNTFKHPPGRTQLLGRRERTQFLGRERTQLLDWERTQLLDALMVSVSGPHKKTMKLSHAQMFSISKTDAIFPTDSPLPSTVLPTSITSSFESDVLVSVFHWRQLSIIEWLRHVTDFKVAAASSEFDVTHSAPWAERVLSVIAQAWPSSSTTVQLDIIEIFCRMSCIPTSAGLKVPNQAYFPSVNLFRDLPIVTMPSGAIVAGELEKVLQLLGVRKYVHLEIIFDRCVRLVPP